MTALLNVPETTRWRSGTCVAVGYAFELEVHAPPDFRQSFAPLLASLRATTTTAGRAVARYEIRPDPTAPLPYTLFFEGKRVASGSRGSHLTRIFSWHVNRQVIDRSVDRYVLLHAAAAVRAGISVLLPADQECGKTTTVAGLLRHGFSYITDEAVAIDPDTTRIVPFPKALSLDPGSWPLFPECRPLHSDALRQWQVPAKSLGARCVTGSASPPRVIVLPKYVAGSPTVLTPISRAEAVRQLAQLTFDFPRHAQRNLQVLSRIAASATVARLVIGSLDEAVRVIEGLISIRIMEEL